MKFGWFDNENREYVITNPQTPLPWINYLGNENYFGIISNTAGGYSFYRDARLRRISRYRYNNVPEDFGGRYIYLRDQKSGKFWSPSWKPTFHADQTDYVSRHGLGKTTIASTYEGIEAETCYFVPLGADLEVWRLRLTNHRESEASLSTFSCIEFCLWNADDDAINFQRNLSIGEVEIENNVIYHKTEYRERRNHFAFFACSEPISAFDTQREAFLGKNRSWDRPVAVEKGQLTNSVAHGWSPMGSHQVDLALAPGETREIIFILGYHENDPADKFSPSGSQVINKTTVRPTIEKYLQPAAVDSALAELKAYWDNLLNVFQVETPDENTNSMVNIWNAYQCMVTYNLSRSASLFESGIGRGMGFRDSNQDLLAFVQMEPERAKERILDLAATQLEDGGAFHQYQPLTKRGNNAVGGDFNDDPHWLVLAVSAYLKETGDFSILDAQVPFNNRPSSEVSLYEHLQRSIEFTLDRLGPHGLPLIGRADWNDCLNLNIFSEEPGESFQTAPLKTDQKVAESIFIGGLFTLSARELASIAEKIGNPVDAKCYWAEAQKMTAAVESAGWDGEWFLRAYDAFGDPVGSKANEDGKIWVEPQGMCIMGGIGLESGKARQALDSVYAHLAKPQGLVLLQPALSRYYLKLGEIGSYPPGVKENASVFCHNNPWVMIAETMIDRGERAFDYYNRTNPAAQEETSEIRRCEPYVYAQTVAGPDAYEPGVAKNSWLTGAASYHYVAITQYILGVRPTFDGLQVSPKIPESWSGFSATRKFRNVLYQINVKRVGPGNTIRLTVDGQPIKGDVIPLPLLEKTRVSVAVTLGGE